ncbi:DNA mismatch repair protein MutS [Capnocytophaga leadbetteri]|uniref:DNA mismatch repair protein MutS n=1 Tax=Capnocytophaga leadbetteri TaxID=327575 RepID=A0A250F9P8_9FLAO|nr:DNA mismatch repair protein MutS [Capnocytophaga leadbetteri]ATA81852.1 DNA mismatch repair protein MutS [Capnocytophaga leadbetteri]
MAKETPLMKQYNQIKSKYPDALLLFRVGDFYETFGEDAVKAAHTLDIVLTNRNNGSERSELAGFPYHSINTYLPKLVKAGYRVAICDQLEDPKLVKGIVKRGVTELVTPGVALNDDILQSKNNNFLASVWLGKQLCGIAFLDISTGEFLVAQGDKPYIDKLLQNFKPSEILIAKQQKKAFAESFGEDFHCFFLEDWVFKDDYARQALTKHFQTNSLKGFGVDELTEAILTAGAILYYLSETQHHQLQHITTLQRIAEDAYVWLDRFTIRNLELYAGSSAQSVTLIDVIDKTLSPMGSRTLKRWLALPLKKIEKIEQRHEVVAYLLSHTDTLSLIKDNISRMGDIERLISKVATLKINPREVVQLCSSLEHIVPIKQQCLQSGKESLSLLGDKLHNCQQLCTRIRQTLTDEAPVNIAKGNAIAAGFSAELDELRNLSHTGKSYLDDLLLRETQRTGIPSLKIDNNNVFGYYIEVRNTHKDKVPADWVRKQTLVNAERYITDELKEYEAKIVGAEERISQLEQSLYAELISYISEYIAQVQTNATLIGQLDTLCGFATLALENHYNRPEMSESYVIDIKEGRHPVIEKQLTVGTPYIANDVYLDRDTQQLMMITGPNMSGKSAILRQTALIVLLAQIGSFVPATSAHIGIVDKIFTRVGASDNISVGESTFMVEMNEAALILNNLSDRSLILLDEIGRGTSTYDGISIAWAIAEYLHEHPSRAKTLFATHYHELNEMTEQFERIKNYNVTVKETQDSVLFLRKLAAGGSAHSFGIHVAKMAGMPQYVVQKANKMLQKLEQMHNVNTTEAVKAAQKEMQLSFFDMSDPRLDELKNDLLSLDINSLTPVEALMKLNEMKKLLN